MRARSCRDSASRVHRSSQPSRRADKAMDAGKSDAHRRSDLRAVKLSRRHQHPRRQLRRRADEVEAAVVVAAVVVVVAAATDAGDHRPPRSRP